jgi:hypothetical protein
MGSDQLLTARQVATRLGVDPRIVARARIAGQIPGWVRVGSRWYLPRAMLNEFLRIPAVTPLEPRPAIRFRRG